MPEPTTITAGLSYAWSKSFSDYPAGSGWTLAYSIVNNKDQFDVSSSANGDDFDVAIPTSESADYVPGLYRLIGYVDDGTDRKQVYCGDLIIQPDFTEVADMRSYAERVLGAIESVIEGSATKDQQSVMVDGQTLIRRTPTDLIMLRDRFRREVESERRAANMANGETVGRVQLRFQ